jgi:AcrR family transcriptional regulator
MARKPAAPPKASPALPPPGGTDREKIVTAFMELLAEKRFEEIGFTDISARSGLSLAAIRTEFGSTLSIWAAFAKQVDRAVLAGADADMADEPPRERLFDVLMRRLEVVAPHREALRSLTTSLSRNPPLALAFNPIAVRSQVWMLTAAGIGTGGLKGMVRAQGLTMLFGSVLRTWLDDDDPGLARTLAALDKALGRGQRWSGMLNDLCRFSPGKCRSRFRRRRHEEDEEPAAA